MSQIGLTRDDKIDFERLVVVSFGKSYEQLVNTAAATDGRSIAMATNRRRIFLHRNGKLVTIWALTC